MQAHIDMLIAELRDTRGRMEHSENQIRQMAITITEFDTRVREVEVYTSWATANFDRLYDNFYHTESWATEVRSCLKWYNKRLEGVLHRVQQLRTNPGPNAQYMELQPTPRAFTTTSHTVQPLGFLPNMSLPDPTRQGHTQDQALEQGGQYTHQSAQPQGHYGPPHGSGCQIALQHGGSTQQYAEPQPYNTNYHQQGLPRGFTPLPPQHQPYPAGFLSNLIEEVHRESQGQREIQAQQAQGPQSQQYGQEPPVPTYDPTSEQGPPQQGHNTESQRFRDPHSGNWQ